MSTRCSNCGREADGQAAFCLNCGTPLRSAAAVPVATGGTHAQSEAHSSGPTPQSGGGLPASGTRICTQCGVDNAAAMRFCRQCGTPLPAELGAPISTPTATNFASSAPSVDGGKTMLSAPPDMPSPGAMVGPGTGAPAAPTPPAGVPRVKVPEPVRAEIKCGSCGGETPAGYSFCQRCGKSLNPEVPAASAPSQPITEPAVGGVPARSTKPTPKSMRIATVAEPPWAHLVAVHRDGSEGESYPMHGDYVEIGSSTSAALRFVDPYLAGVHARIERVGASTARIVPLDKLNGVFLRVRAPVEIHDDSDFLIGRQLLRYNLVAAGEREGKSLIQHGVTLFGSPERPVWARLSQLQPTGGILDIRHFHEEEVAIGREDGHWVFRDDEFMSRRHAVLKREKGCCMLADLGSSNGTFLRLREPSNLVEGDFLRVGDQMFRMKLD